MSSRWKALIVGCGRIAGGYNNGPNDADVLTHALAYVRHPDYALAGCVDPDEVVAADFGARWKVPAVYSSLDEALQRDSFDIVSVCTPTGTHLGMLERLLDAGLRGVMAEKPLDGDADGARRLAAAFAARGIPVAVNFTRRFDRSMHTLRDAIRGGLYGALHSVVGWYGRGVVNNGSHLVDLVSFLTDRRAMLIHVGEGQPAGVAKDVTASALLDLGGVPAHLIGCPGPDAARFECEIALADAVVSLEEGGLVQRIRPVATSAAFAVERIPGRGSFAATHYGTAMLRALDEIRAWQPGSRLSSDLESAADAIELAGRIRDRSLEKAL